MRRRHRPSVSLCIYTNGPAARVRALLKLCRPVVDEIVVAVDVNGDPRMLGACAGVADEVVRMGSHMPETVVGWLMHRCRGDWILRLDSDEVPSAALVEQLPGLVADPRPLAFHFTRRWLWPDTNSHIVAAPWLPDYQPRLLRNLPGLWRMPGRRHTTPEVDGGDQRLVDAPIYHADLILSGREARELKAERYELDRPGHNALGFPVNGMYVPELYEPAVENVPDEDQRVIEQVLEGARVPWVPRPRRRSSFIVAADLAGVGEARPIYAEALRATIGWPRMPDALAPGSTSSHELVVQNIGTEWWPRGSGDPQIRIGHRWLDTHATTTFSEGRAYFTEAVPPGATTRLMLELEAPEEPGPYLLDVDLVFEHVQWCRTGRRHIVSVRDIEPPQHWQPRAAQVDFTH